jgi:MFS family permease
VPLLQKLKNIPTFVSLGLRDYRLLWLGQVTSSMAMQMDQLSRSWLIFDLTGSALQLGAVNAVRGVPLLAFGLIAGVAADLWGRKAQIIIAQTTNAALNIILATLVITGHVQVWHLYVTGFLAGTVQAFQQPARQVLVSDIVGENYLLNAISLNSAAVNISRSVGPALSGFFIHFFGPAISDYTQGGLYALATLWTIQMRVPKSSTPAGLARSSAEQSIFSSLKEGFVYIGKHRMILALMVLALAPVLLGMPYQSLMPIFAHGDSGKQGLLMMPVGIGAIVGALTIASFGRRQGSGKLMITGAAGFGLSLVLFSQSPALQMAMAFTFMVGLCNTSYASQNQTILQLLTPQELRGRVLGIYMLDRGLMPLGSLLAGALAEVLGAPWAVTIMGASCFLLAIGVAIFVPALWKLNLKPNQDTIK